MNLVDQLKAVLISELTFQLSQIPDQYLVLQGQYVKTTLDEDYSMDYPEPQVLLDRCYIDPDEGGVWLGGRFDSEEGEELDPISAEDVEVLVLEYFLNELRADMPVLDLAVSVPFRNLAYQAAGTFDRLLCDALSVRALDDEMGWEFRLMDSEHLQERLEAEMTDLGLLRGDGIDPTWEREGYPPGSAMLALYEGLNAVGPHVMINLEIR